jgi:hypothetical protein
MRVLKRFREKGLIETAQSQIIVTDLEGLKERAHITSFYLSIIEETL